MLNETRALVYMTSIPSGHLPLLASASASNSIAPFNSNTKRLDNDLLFGVYTSTGISTIQHGGQSEY